MDAQYCKEKIVKLHDEVVLLKAQHRADRNCIRIHKALAIAGWLAFIVALYYGH